MIKSSKAEKNDPRLQTAAGYNKPTWAAAGGSSQRRGLNMMPAFTTKSRPITAPTRQVVNDLKRSERCEDRMARRARKKRYSWASTARARMDNRNVGMVIPNNIGLKLSPHP